MQWDLCSYLHMVGDLLFESTFQNINKDVTWSFSCLYLQKIACPRKKYNIIERLKSKEYVMPLFILQRCWLTGSITFCCMYNCGSKNHFDPHSCWLMLISVLLWQIIGTQHIIELNISINWIFVFRLAIRIFHQCTLFQIGLQIIKCCWFH